MSLTGTLLLSGGLAFLVSLTANPWLARHANRLGLIDHPGERKLHRHPIPTTGGIAILLGILAAATLPLLVGRVAPGAIDASVLDSLLGDAAFFAPLLWGLILLHAMGLVDDRGGLSVGGKLGLQIVAILPLLTFEGMRLLPQWLPLVASVPPTLLWFLAIVNAFNFLDGMDGLLGVVALVCAAEFALVAGLEGQWTTVVLLAGVGGALLGFLPFNLPRARVFAGDAGSHVVGFLLAFASVRITYHAPGAAADTPPHAVLAPLVILGVPLYDLLSVIWLRLRRGASPLEADRGHLLHRLQRQGLGVGRVLVVVGLVTFATGSGGVVLVRSGPLAAVLLALGSVALLGALAVWEWRSTQVERLEDG